MAEHDPDPLSDVRQGLGLLFRAAKTAARKIPTKNLEDAVATSAREVGRAIENVATTIERQVFGKSTQTRGSESRPEEKPGAGSDSSSPSSQQKDADSPGDKRDRR